MVGLDGEENVPHSQWVRIFGEVVDEIKQEMKDRGRDDDVGGARVCLQL